MQPICIDGDAEVSNNVGHVFKQWNYFPTA
jgi:hypothetical protein